MTSPFQPEDLVLVRLVRDAHYDQFNDGPLFVPADTQLIGVWSPEQPADPAIHAVTVGETPWHFADEYATISPLDASVHPWEEQERLAQASLTLAKMQEQQEHVTEAQVLYARALVELEASGKTAHELVDIRLKRAFLLRQLEEVAESVTEFGRAARVFERNIMQGLGQIDRGEAELAAQALNAMASTILHHAHPTQEPWPHKLREIQERFDRLEPYLSRRYVSKVEVMLTRTEILQAQGSTKEALVLFEQANTLYMQKHLDADPTSKGITLHLERLKLLFGQTPKKKTTKKRTSTRRKT